MSRDEVMRKWKIFWAWQDDEEAAWLQSMSQKGWHVEHVAPYHYTFRRGAPENYSYGIDYVTTAKADIPSYLQLFSDTGWEYVSSTSGYYYFRTKSGEGERKSIFNNNESKIQKYRRILLILAIISTPMWLLMITGRMEYMLSRGGFVGIMYKSMVIVLIPVIVLYIIAFIKLIRKIGRHSRKLHE